MRVRRRNSPHAFFAFLIRPTSGSSVRPVSTSNSKAGFHLERRRGAGSACGIVILGSPAVRRIFPDRLIADRRAAPATTSARDRRHEIDTDGNENLFGEHQRVAGEQIHCGRSVDHDGVVLARPRKRRAPRGPQAQLHPSSVLGKCARAAAEAHGRHCPADRHPPTTLSVRASQDLRRLSFGSFQDDFRLNILSRLSQ